MSERTNVSNIGVGANFRTYKIDNSTITFDRDEENGSAQVGLAVTFSAADTVELTADADPVVGKLIKVEADNKATVQTEGTMRRSWVTWARTAPRAMCGRPIQRRRPSCVLAAAGSRTRARRQLWW